MALQRTRARGLGRKEEDTRMLSRVSPSLAQVGMAAGSTAGKTERFNRGVTQGARFQRDLRQQAADARFREAEMAQRAEEARLGREFTAEQARLGREFTAGESELGREARAAEAQLGREARAEESRLGRKFTAEQAQLGRELRQAEQDRADYRTALGIEADERKQMRDIATRRDIARARLGADMASAAQRAASAGKRDQISLAGKLDSEIINIQSQIAKLDPDDDADKIKRLREQAARHQLRASGLKSAARPTLGR